MLQVLQALLSLASRGKGQLQVLQALLPYVLLHKGLRVVAWNWLRGDMLPTGSLRTPEGE